MKYAERTKNLVRAELSRGSGTLRAWNGNRELYHIAISARFIQANSGERAGVYMVAVQLRLTVYFINLLVSQHSASLWTDIEYRVADGAPLLIGLYGLRRGPPGAYEDWH